MTPKEKAKELVHIYDLMQTYIEDFSFDNAKQCALIAVDEIIYSMNSLLNINEIDNGCEHIFYEEKYYEEVKQEIEKL